MGPVLTGAREGTSELMQQAERLERLATFMSRPDGRMHLFERAAEFRAMAALMEAATQHGNF